MLSLFTGIGAIALKLFNRAKARPFAPLLIIVGVVLWLFSVVYNDFTDGLTSAGRLEAEREADARSDKVKAIAEAENEKTRTAIEAERLRQLARIKGLDDATREILLKLPDLTKNNPACRVPDDVVKLINGVK